MPPQNRYAAVGKVDGQANEGKRVVHAAGHNYKRISNLILPVRVGIIRFGGLSWSPYLHRHNHDPKNGADYHLGEETHLKKNRRPLVEMPRTIRIILRILTVDLVQIQGIFSNESIQLVLIFGFLQSFGGLSLLVNNILKDLIVLSLRNQ